MLLNRLETLLWQLRDLNTCNGCGMGVLDHPELLPGTGMGLSGLDQNQ